MKREYINAEEALSVAKEAIWVAWNACGGPFGLGVLQDNPAADKQQVWKQAYEMGDYSGRDKQMKTGYVNADYVFGRMLKLRFSINENVLDIPDSQPQPDYQGWCRAYKTYDDLFNIAEMRIKP